MRTNVPNTTTVGTDTAWCEERFLGISITITIELDLRGSKAICMLQGLVRSLGIQYAFLNQACYISHNLTTLDVFVKSSQKYFCYLQSSVCRIKLMEFIS